MGTSFQIGQWKGVCFYSLVERGTISDLVVKRGAFPDLVSERGTFSTVSRSVIRGIFQTLCMSILYYTKYIQLAPRARFCASFINIPHISQKLQQNSPYLWIAPCNL